MILFKRINFKKCFFIDLRLYNRLCLPDIVASVVVVIVVLLHPPPQPFFSMPFCTAFNSSVFL